MDNSLSPGAYSQTLRALNRDLQELISEFQQVWLARNRPGGLPDSVARFEKARLDYVDSGCIFWTE
jgi:hypothetical protein